MDYIKAFHINLFQELNIKPFGILSSVFTVQNIQADTDVAGEKLK